MPNSKQSAAAPIVSVVQKPALKPPPPSGVDYVLGLFGPDVFMVPFEHGQKRPPKGFKWKDATLARTQEPVWRAVLAESTIAIRVGPESNNLIAIDFDDDEHWETFLDDNPLFNNTTRSHGVRGCQVWVRMVGDYPQVTMKCEDGGDPPGTACEWRAGGGGLSTIYGQHPSGEHYERIKDVPPISIEFKDIVWHAGWQVPGVQSAEQRLEAAYGQAIMFTNKGMPKGFNQNFFCARFLAEHRLEYDIDLKIMLEYRTDTGLWVEMPSEVLRTQLNEDVIAFIHAAAKALPESAAAIETGIPLISQGWLVQTCSMIHDHAARQSGMFSGRRPTHLHFKNCMLEIDPPTFKQKPFAPEFYSRNQCPANYDPAAGCPKFISDVLDKALCKDDQDMLQNWFGQALLGYNLHQVLLILKGTSGGSKGMLSNLIQNLIGEDNVGTLDTHQLGDNFEIGLMAGRTLLYAGDVLEDFFTTKDASRVKSIVGGDRLRGEIKGGGLVKGLRGHFNVLATCNCELLFRLQKDALAWERRVLIIEFNLPASEDVIRDFEDVLIKEEGSGIVNWCLTGMQRVVDAANCGQPFPRTEAQKKIVTDLMTASDSVREFVETRIQRSSFPLDAIATDTMFQHYMEMCSERGWTPLTKVDFGRRLNPILTTVLRAVPSENVLDANKNRKRGFRGIVFCAHQDVETQEQESASSENPY